VWKDRRRPGGKPTGWVDAVAWCHKHFTGGCGGTNVLGNFGGMLKVEASAGNDRVFVVQRRSVLVYAIPVRREDSGDVVGVVPPETLILNEMGQAKANKLTGVLKLTAGHA